jgi:hypothetical protein
MQSWAIYTRDVANKEVGLLDKELELVLQSERQALQSKVRALQYQKGVILLQLVIAVISLWVHYLNHLDPEPGTSPCLYCGL